VVAMVLCGLALGLLSHGSRLFEGLYVTVWYLGPANRMPALDFAGVSPAALAAGTPYVFVLVGAGLLAVALAAERRRAVELGARFA
jgi:hypothetical protein